MCIQIYVASAKSLPYSQWSIPRWDIEVSGPIVDSSDMAGVFSKPYIYTVYATPTGDGCGFQYDNLKGQQAREALADFLERALSVVPELELFVRYFDPTTGVAKPTSYDQIGPSDIRTWRSQFTPDEFLVVTEEVES
jgi:hypothetical protein